MTTDSLSHPLPCRRSLSITVCFTWPWGLLKLIGRAALGLLKLLGFVFLLFLGVAVASAETCHQAVPTGIPDGTITVEVARCSAEAPTVASEWLLAKAPGERLVAVASDAHRDALLFWTAEGRTRVLVDEEDFEAPGFFDQARFLGDHLELRSEHRTILYGLEPRAHIAWDSAGHGLSGAQVSPSTDRLLWAVRLPSRIFLVTAPRLAPTETTILDLPIAPAPDVPVEAGWITDKGPSTLWVRVANWLAVFRGPVPVRIREIAPREHVHFDPVALHFLVGDRILDLDLVEIGALTSDEPLIDTRGQVRNVHLDADGRAPEKGFVRPEHVPEHAWILPAGFLTQTAADVYRLHP